MKKVFKRPAKIVIGIFVFFTLISFYLLSDFNIMFKNERYIIVDEKIKKSVEDKQLNSFVYFYNKIYKPSEKYCSCELATHHINRYNVFKPSISKKIYYLKLRTRYKEESCLKFRLLNQYFLNDILGIKEASQYYFSKTLDQLNEEEKMTLFVMFQNPVLYNPDRNKEMIREKVQYNLSLLK